MNSTNELLDNYIFPEEDQLIPKMEPIDIEFIKQEEIEEECHVEPGVVVSLKVDKVSVKEELCKNEETNNCSSSNVRNNLILGRHEVKDYCRYPSVGVRCAPCVIPRPSAVDVRIRNL